MSNQKNDDNIPMINYLNKIFTLKDINDVFDLVINTIKVSIGCKRVSIMIADTTNEFLILKKHTGIDDQIGENIKIKIDDSYAGQVYRSGEPLIINNMEKFGLVKQYSDYDAFLIMPLSIINHENKKTIIGVINITNKLDNKPFTEEDEKIVSNISTNATLAIAAKL